MSTPVFEWLVGAAGAITEPVQFHGGEIPACGVVVIARCHEKLAHRHSPTIVSVVEEPGVRSEPTRTSHPRESTRTDSERGIVGGRARFGNSPFGTLAQGHFLFKAGIAFACSVRCGLFCLSLMPRKGWSSVPVPGGWLQVVRGPRPPSVRWLLAERNSSVVLQGRQLPKTPTGQTKVRNLQAALDVLGTEDSNVKEELQAALQRVKEHVARPAQSVRLSPEAAKTAARLKVDRLEKAVEALGDYDGPELAGLKQALKKARELAQELPIDVQITQCKEFIERSEKRFAKMEAERIAEKKLLEEGRARLVRLEQAFSVRVGNVADVSMVAPDTEVKLARLRAQVAELQENVVTERPRVRQRVGGGGPAPPMPTLVPAELSEWMVDRQAELQEAMNAGDNLRVLTVTSKLSEAAQHMCELMRSTS